MSSHTFYNAIFSGCGAGHVTGVDNLIMPQLLDIQPRSTFSLLYTELE